MFVNCTAIPIMEMRVNSSRTKEVNDIIHINTKAIGWILISGHSTVQLLDIDMDDLLLPMAQLRLMLYFYVGGLSQLYTALLLTATDRADV
jgi:hypothetical protein